MLPKKETLTIEFKSDLKKYPNSEIFEVVVGLANTDGGDLYCASIARAESHIFADFPGFESQNGTFSGTKMQSSQSL